MIKAQLDKTHGSGDAPEEPDVGPEGEEEECVEDDAVEDVS